MRGRKGRSTGGVNDAEKDLGSKSMSYTKDSNVEKEAKERKSGGRAARKCGGLVPGGEMKHHAGRKPRKSGGRTGSDTNPFTSARRGTPPKGHKMDGDLEG